ncbi:MAG TPA: hypothetical protein VEB60_01575 [Candidatus Paceibacterota bacterium]|nr:hypothetical protein [Candidatus Paceibacterota bacterium]
MPNQNELQHLLRALPDAQRIQLCDMLYGFQSWMKKEREHLRELINRHGEIKISFGEEFVCSLTATNFGLKDARGHDSTPLELFYELRDRPDIYLELLDLAVAIVQELSNPD